MDMIRKMVLREYYKMFPKVINVKKSGRDRMIKDGFFEPEKCDYCYNIIDETPILELAKENVLLQKNINIV